MKRWLEQPVCTVDEFNDYLQKLQRQFRAYKTNIYILNRVSSLGLSVFIVRAQDPAPVLRPQGRSRAQIGGEEGAF